MKYNFKIALMLIALIAIISCNKDDDSTVNIVPLSEQAPIDDELLREFLTNNYYNEEEFANAINIANFKYDIEFSEDASVTGYDSNGDGVIDGSDVDNSTVYNRTKLIDLVTTKVVQVDGVDHNMYLLNVRQGGGAEKPHFCDSTFVAYKGINLEKELFDSTVNPIWFDLTSVIKGFSESLSEFNPAASFVSNGDGTYTYSDFGVGAVFLPSGLGYYAAPPIGISAYSPLVFSFKLMSKELADHDNDGIPSYLEDLDNDRDLRTENTDGDTFANYGDTDDDGDGTATKNEVTYEEYSINNGDPDPTLAANEYVIDRKPDPNNVGMTLVSTVVITDSNNDGTPDYLDASVHQE